MVHEWNPISDLALMEAADAAEANTEARPQTGKSRNLVPVDIGDILAANNFPLMVEGTTVDMLTILGVINNITHEVVNLLKFTNFTCTRKHRSACAKQSKFLNCRQRTYWKQPKCFHLLRILIKKFIFVECHKLATWLIYPLKFDAKLMAKCYFLAPQIFSHLCNFINAPKN